MQKGKFGICLWFYAALAFILAFLGQTLLCGLLLGFVIIAEKSEWLSRQVIQAFFLSIAVSIVSGVLNILHFLETIPFVGTVFGFIFSGITGLVSLLVLIIAILALVRVTKEQEADLPLLSKLANRAYGLVEQKVYAQAPTTPPAAPYVQPQPPVYAAPPAPPAPQPPVQQAPVVPQAPVQQPPVQQTPDQPQ